MADIKSWTGERLETFVYNENTNEHLHRYALALQLVAGKRVLDIACGEGYGSNLMAATAAKVTGVDIDAATIATAIEKYKADNLHFLEGRADKIPCDSGSFDIVVSFETIEHHDRHEEMMQEIKRVLKPGGILLISSPDKLYYSEQPKYKNPFHVKELYRYEFESLLERYFKQTIFMGQKSFFGSVIIPYPGGGKADKTTVYKGDYNAISQAGLEAVYVIGLASDEALPDIHTTLLDGAGVLRKQFEDLREEVTRGVAADVSKQLRRSLSFRIGYFILSPLRLIKKLFGG